MIIKNVRLTVASLPLFSSFSSILYFIYIIYYFWFHFDIFKYFHIPLYVDYLSDFHKKFQIIAVAYDIKVECQIWNFCCNLFLNYTDNNTHSDQLLKMWFLGFKGPQNVSFHQNCHFKNLFQKQYFLYCTQIRKSNEVQFKYNKNSIKFNLNLVYV